MNQKRIEEIKEDYMLGLTYKEIENIFKSWMSGNYKNMSMQQITNMTQLYYNLFKEVPKWKNRGKLRYLMEHNLKT